ncbi:class I SAM-dependent methyltransferase [Flavobacteriaceae bacterium]|nr:class I SAM-dependent methyltransferase [Flavobacteriaceae bacterium]
MSNYKHILTTKDFLVTGETFEISKNLETGILETLPKPNQPDLHKYYDSKNYISHNQKPSSFFSFCYKQVRSISTAQKIKICSKQLDQKDRKKEVRVLDVGCGAGYFLIKCLEKGWIVKGVENNNNAKNMLPPEIYKHVYDGFETLKKPARKV